MPRAAVLGMAGVATAAAVALGATGIYYVISRDATPTAPAASGSSEPAVSDATDATDGATTDPNDTAADAAQAMPEATGAPAHFMQLAELLAMDSSRLDGFLTDQGLYRYTGGDSTLDNQLNGNLDVWVYGGAVGDVLRSTLPEDQISEGELSLLVEDDGSVNQGFLTWLSGYLTTNLQFGADGCILAYGQITDQMTGQEVSRGQTPACVMLPALPILWLAKDELDTAAHDLFGFLGEGNYCYAWASFIDDGLRSRTVSYQGVVGTERVNGAEGIWFVYQNGVDHDDELSGIMSERTAAGFVFLPEAEKSLRTRGSIPSRNGKPQIRRPGSGCSFRVSSRTRATWTRTSARGRCA